jgi:hypothetical protein
VGRGREGKGGRITDAFDGEAFACDDGLDFFEMLKWGGNQRSG